MKYLIWTILGVLTFCNCQSQDLLPFNVGTLWGYKDKQGIVKIEPQFQYAKKFIGKIAIVAKNNKLGAIDRKNNIIVPLRYEFLQLLDTSTSEFLFGHRAKYFGEHIMGVMTKDEKVKIPAVYNYISKHNGTYTVTKNVDSIIGKNAVGDVRSVKSFNGLVDSNGKFLIPCKYDYINWINDTLIDVTTGGLGTSHALFNNKGKQLTGFEYMVFGKFIEGVAKARIGEKFGFIFPNGKVAIPIKFDYCEDFSNGYALIKHHNKWGAINKKGEIIIEPKFDYQEVKTTLKEKYLR
jgi:hypothetical protein